MHAEVAPAPVHHPHHSAAASGEGACSQGPEAESRTFHARTRNRKVSRVPHPRGRARRVGAWMRG
jgi:hypothetical protein